MGEVLSPALGATPADWGRVNREVYPGIWANQHTWGTDPKVRIRREAVDNLTGMCRALRIEPPDEDGCCELMRSVDVHVGRTGAAAYPWAADSIRALAGLASGTRPGRDFEIRSRVLRRHLRTYRGAAGNGARSG